MLKVHKLEWTFDEESQLYMWYPLEYTECPEPDRDLEKEQEDWERTLEKYENEPDIPF